MSNTYRKYDIEHLTEPVTIRLAGTFDDPTIARLAELDTAPSLTGLCLIAERDRRPVAACQIGSGRVIADPFQPTEDIVEMLEARARALRHEDEGGRHRSAMRKLTPGGATAALRSGTGGAA